MDIGLVLIALVVFFLGYLYMKSRQKYGRLPPGPPSIPILGSLPWLGSDVREPLRQMTKKYGDVFTVYMGSQPAIVLNSYEAIKEAFVKNAHAFSGRPEDWFYIREVSKGLGVVSANGELWREQRKFTHTVLREFGMGKAIIEDKIHEELPYFLGELDKHVGQPLNLAHIIQTTVSNLICSITFGERYEYEDPVFINFLAILNHSFEIQGNMGALNVIPALKYLPGDLFGFKQLMEEKDYMLSIFRDMIKQHRANANFDDPRDFIDAFLKQMAKEEGNPDTTFYDDQLLFLIMDLFSAGTETTATTLRWAILYMLHNPSVQTKVQKEVDDIIGRNRPPSMRNRAQMPYTEATILETLRLGDIAPLGLPHAITEDITFRDYVLPKGTLAISHYYAVNRDPELWPEPFKFDPTRFLDAEGKLDKKEYLVPFSMGRRVCLGETLAKTELFLFFTTLAQRYTFQLPEGDPLPSLTGTLALTNMPPAYKVMVVPRT